MNPRTHTMLPLAAIAGLALAASAGAATVIANFSTTASTQQGVWMGGLFSSTALGGSTASPFTFNYNISSLGLGAADKLKITVATTGANLSNGGNNGIAVVGGNNSWWEESDGALSFTVAIADASNVDITSSFTIDLTGASIRWVNAVSPTPAVTLSVAGSGPFSHATLLQGVDLPTGQTAETSFTASRTGNTTGQFQQLRFEIAAIPEPSVALILSFAGLSLLRRRRSA